MCVVVQKHKAQRLDQLKRDFSEMKYKPVLKRQIGFFPLLGKDIVDKRNNICRVTEKMIANRVQTGGWKRIMNRPMVLQMWSRQGQIVIMQKSPFS